MKFDANITKNAFRYKIQKAEVIKIKSEYSGLTSFSAVFTFVNGYVASFPLTDARKEFELIPTIDLTHNDRMKAQCLACEQDLKLKLLFENETVLYGRVKCKFPFSEQYAVSLYIKDESSPTGVIQASISCSDAQARNYGICSLSPTEDLRTAH
jgi:hypothetical protein